MVTTKSHSRPHVNNDNSYSEAKFKTLKYRPDFPGQFGSPEDARSFCHQFFAWHNGVHRHSGISFHTPADVHYGQASGRHAFRAQVLATAYAAHPDRFVRKHPEPPAPWGGLDQPSHTGGRLTTDFPNSICLKDGDIYRSAEGSHATRRLQRETVGKRAPMREPPCGCRKRTAPARMCQSSEILLRVELLDQDDPEAR